MLSSRWWWTCMQFGKTVSGTPFSSCLSIHRSDSELYSFSWEIKTFWVGRPWQFQRKSETQVGTWAYCWMSRPSVIIGWVCLLNSGLASRRSSARSYGQTAKSGGDLGGGISDNKGREMTWDLVTVPDWFPSSYSSSIDPCDSSIQTRCIQYWCLSLWKWHPNSLCSAICGSSVVRLMFVGFRSYPKVTQRSPVLRLVPSMCG